MKKIVILEVDSGDASVAHYVMWLPVPSIYQVAFSSQSLTSLYKGASVLEVASIQGGQVVERLGQTALQPGWSLAQIKTELIRNHSIQVAVFDANTSTYTRYGVSWDGTTWSV